MSWSGHLLLKFFSQKKYRDDFCNGIIYMNTLYYFWDEYPRLQALKRSEEARARAIAKGENPDNIFTSLCSPLSDSQKDLFEGTVTTYDLDTLNLDSSMKVGLFCDPVLRAEGYRYCNVACFYRLDCTISSSSNKYKTVAYDIPKQMDEFGKYVIVIINEKEFINRIRKAVNACGFKFLCGNVQYHDLKKGDHTIISGERVILEAETKIPLNGKGVQIVEQRDCFDKMVNYKSQKEWRIALYRGLRSTDPYTLEVGSLRDIVRCFSFEDFTKVIDSCFAGDLSCIVSNRIDGWYGNISRNELRECFYKLGDYMSVPLISLGNPNIEKV